MQGTAASSEPGGSNTALSHSISSPAARTMATVILLPTSRLFVYLFLVPSVDGTKPPTGSKQAASCLKFKGTLRRPMGQDWNSLTCSTTAIKKKRNDTTYST